MSYRMNIPKYVYQCFHNLARPKSTAIDAIARLRNKYRFQIVLSVSSRTIRFT